MNFKISIVSFILLIIICDQSESKSFVSFPIKKIKSGDLNIKVSHTEKAEIFEEFLEDFTLIKDFQISRVVFPLLDCAFPGEINSHCDTINKSNWQHLVLLDTSKSVIQITKIYDNWNLKMNDTAERVLSFETNGKNVCSFYFFKRIENKWYLVKRLVCED
ncbi:MAG: hypothetical protein ABI772_12790 [Bacteroidota bacterium]